MKKITTLLMAMVGWLFAVNVSAQTLTVSETPTEAANLETGYYVIKTIAKGDTGFMYHESGASARPFRQWLTDSLTNLENKFVWKLTKNDDGTFTLRNYASKAYVPADSQHGMNMTSSTESSNAALLKYNTYDAYEGSLPSGVTLYQTNYSNFNIHVNTPNPNATDYRHNFSYWEGGSVSSSSSLVEFAFYKVSGIEEPQAVTVTYNVMLNSTTVKTLTVEEVAIGTTAATPSSVEASYYYGTPTLTSASSDASDLTVSADNNTFNVTYTTTATLATEPTAAADLTDGTYVLKVATGDLDTQGYFNHSSSCTANRPFHLTSGDVDITNANYLWKLVKTGAGFTLQNVGTGAYVPADADKNKNMSTSTAADHAAVLVAEAIEGGKLTNGVALYDANNTSDNVSLYIYKNGHTDGNTYANGSYWTNKNLNGAMVQFAFYKVTNTPQQTRPFDESKVYTIKFRNQDSKYASHVRATDADILTNVSMNSWANMKGGLWQIKESGLGVKLYNYARQKYVTLANSNNGTRAALGDEGSEFIVCTNTTGGFTLQCAGVSNAVLGDHASSHLGVWNANVDIKNDGGSNFGIEEASFETAKSLLNSDIESTTVGDIYTTDNYLQYVTNSESLEAAKTAVQSATTIGDLLAIEVGASFAPEVGAYYQIIAKPYIEDNTTATKCFITSDGIAANAEGTLDTSLDEANNRRILRAASSDALVPQLWQFEKAATDGYYNIKSANVGQYFGQVTGNDVCIEMPIAKDGAGAYALQKGQDNQYALLVQSDGHMLNAHGGSSNNIVADWNGNSVSDNGSNWVIKKVTEVPVTISEVGYASLALPFAVTIPEESGVKAYYATTVDQTLMTLTEISGNVIPANTGVILASNGATTVNLTISDAVDGVEQNLLNAATAKRSGFKADDTYVLALNSFGKAAFLQSELTVVPANKAYLPTNAIPTEGAAATLNFKFGGNATGINAVNAEESNDTYYDLSGRRVLYPAKGIFVTGSGKKVFIK